MPSVPPLSSPPSAPSGRPGRRLADPRRCPDCGATLPQPPTTCPGCALPLTGTVALELFGTLQAADALLDRLRSQRADAARELADLPHPAAYDDPVGDRLAGAPAYPHRCAETPRRSWLSAATVPRVLLGLGALCLLVASLVFLAVAWTLLGVGGRTTVLLAGTALAVLGAASAHRRRLPAAAESLSLVAAGLVVLDLVGARAAGWLGDLGGAGLGLLVGLLLLGAGAAATLASRRVSATAALLAPELVAVAGALVAALAGATLGADPAPALLASTLGLALVAGAAHRARLARLRGSTAVAAVLWWAGLVLAGTDRVLPAPSVSQLWTPASAWPLVAAALLGAGVATARRLPHAARLVAAGLAVLPAALALLLPAVDESRAVVVATTTLATALLAAASLALPHRWAAAPLGTVALTVAGPAAGVLLVAAHAAATVLSVGPAWSRGPGVVLDPATPPVPPLLLVPAGIALGLAAAALARLVRPGLLRGATGRPSTPAIALVALVALTTLASYAVPLALVVGGLLALAAVALAAVALAAGRPTRAEAQATSAAGAATAPALAALSLGAALVAALPSAWLTAAVLAGAVAGCVTCWSAAGRVGLAARTLLPPVLAGLVWTVGEIGGIDPAQRGVPVLVVLGALALLRPRQEVETTALLAGGVAAALAVAAAAPGDELTALAVHLTVAGALVTTSSLVHAHRRTLGWLGGALLAAATWARLVELGVVEPEAYTVPSALALLAVGLVRMHRDPAVATARALTPGLVLATVPTLLVTLVDPVSWRAVVLGAACLGLVLAGARLRWAAPVGVGAGVGALLVLREAAPYAAVVPQWILIGIAGALLTAAGATWEQRVRDVLAAGRLLAALR